MEKVVVTMAYIRTDKQLLLALKKRGFGPGKFNGYGGKINDGETIEQAAIRETREEIMVEVDKLEKRALINFSWKTNKNKAIECHVFEIISYHGEIGETEEMKPEWFDINKLPYEKMWDDDPCWMPHFLAGKKFNASFVFNDDDKVIEHKIIFLE
ncbi:MAG: 8-oxo-dGTP diphosphatase [Candidatus Falkowbacteria bacterium]|nr:8-oxo-dGTP diphosphatase [Candidatus Falkowbacteria bacterium]